ncbi:MAG: alpha/beta hydrolase [Deltaproteobacteria bacterium]|nr:MAG: alpha/beta hydrolase [Deltaproteobacteria bacterium]
MHGAAEGFAEAEDGTPIHWSTVGQGAPALVCCDGIGCDGFAWKYLVRDFAQSHRIVRWHYRGHGRSGIPKDRARVGFDDISADLQAVIQATGTKEAVLLGHSMGVQVALEYHRRHPENVVALALICGSHGLPLDTFHDSKALKIILPALIDAAEHYPQAMSLIWRVLAGGELAYQVATHLEVNGRLIRRDDFAPYFTHLSAMDPRLFLGMLKHASEHTAYDHLPNIRVPTLIVAGTDDTFTPYWLSEEMHDRIPGAEMLTVPGGTHVAPIEQPELITLRLEKFLAPLPEARAEKLRSA